MGPVGYWGKAPGTNGSVIGVLWYTVFFHNLGFFGQVILGLVSVVLAVVICDEAEVRMQKHDPGEIILDEVVAIPFVFMGLADTMARTGYAWIYLLVGFALFRLFDIAKPLGISKLQQFPGGKGVVYDDIAAGIASALLMKCGLWAGVALGWITL